MRKLPTVNISTLPINNSITQLPFVTVCYHLLQFVTICYSLLLKVTFKKAHNFASHPLGVRPSERNLIGRRPMGSRPIGSRPTGSRPTGSRPIGSRPSPLREREGGGRTRCYEVGSAWDHNSSSFRVGPWQGGVRRRAGGQIQHGAVARKFEATRVEVRILIGRGGGWPQRGRR